MIDDRKAGDRVGRADAFHRLNVETRELGQNGTYRHEVGNAALRRDQVAASAQHGLPELIVHAGEEAFQY